MRTALQCEWTLVTGPNQEPISVDEAMLQASVSQGDDEQLFLGYIAAGRQAAETELGRGLFTQTRRIQLSGFADSIWLPMAAPLQNDPTATPSTAPVIQYYDGDGALQTLATTVYAVDTISEPGRIVRAPNQSWPTTQSDRARPVLITYVCGWTSVDLIPELIKQGIRVYVAGCDGDRIGETELKAARAFWQQAGQVFWREPACLY